MDGVNTNPDKGESFKRAHQSVDSNTSTRKHLEQVIQRYPNRIGLESKCIREIAHMKKFRRRALLEAVLQIQATTTNKTTTTTIRNHDDNNNNDSDDLFSRSQSRLLLLRRTCEPISRATRTKFRHETTSQPWRLLPVV